MATNRLRSARRRRRIRRSQRIIVDAGYFIPQRDHGECLDAYERRLVNAVRLIELVGPAPSEVWDA